MTRIAQTNPFWRIHLFNWLGRIVFQVSSQACIVYLLYSKQSPIPFPTPLPLKRKILETFFFSIWTLLWIKASIKLYFKVTHAACFMQKLPVFDLQLLTLNISCGFSMSQGLKVIKNTTTNNFWCTNVIRSFETIRCWFYSTFSFFCVIISSDDAGCW